MVLIQSQLKREDTLLYHGIREALILLGNGLVAHPGNKRLRAALRCSSLSINDYWDQLLRLIYRLIFLLILEDCNLLHPKEVSDSIRKKYERRYSLHHLCELAKEYSEQDKSEDLWEKLQIVFRGLAVGEPHLGLPALGGIFTEDMCAALDGARLQNRTLLAAVFRLAWFCTKSEVSRVNWRDISSEELGSIYESLLELIPEISEDTRSFTLAPSDDAKGHSRRATGSYYTPDRLVQALLDSTLEPAITDTIAKNSGNVVDALLQITVVDPSCGLGYFLLAAAHRLADHVARFQVGGTPSLLEHRHALRQVVEHCIFGVDLSRTTVALCRMILGLEVAEPGLSWIFLGSHIQHGNALLGATPELMAGGIPDDAWSALEGDDRRVARVLKKQNQKSTKVEVTSLKNKRTKGTSTQNTVEDSSEDRHQKLVADAWCAAFVWPKQAGTLSEVAPTNELWRGLRDGKKRIPPLMIQTVHSLTKQYHFFHWHLQFPQVFAKGGFTVVLGNPPWIAHAGRAAQPLQPGVKHFLECVYTSFAGYTTTHGVFVEHLPTMLRAYGYLGFIVPSSISELEGYEPTRRAHDRSCDFVGELVDFGEGQFPGVTQPCMALVSRRTPDGRTDAAWGEPWPMARPDLTVVDRTLIARLSTLPRLPPELFGERGLQSDRVIAAHFCESTVPVGRFTSPIRTGSDIQEFCLLQPYIYMDKEALCGRLRSESEFNEVQLLIRQTARYPIAAISDGIAFRNSLLAGFSVPGVRAEALVALLNSSLVRWLHYQRFRDARQPVMPQVKIAHLRAIPAPSGGLERWSEELAEMHSRFVSSEGQQRILARKELDRLVSSMFELTMEEQTRVEEWHKQWNRSM